jgi:hypothetical protein
MQLMEISFAVVQRSMNDASGFPGKRKSDRQPDKQTEKIGRAVRLLPSIRFKVRQ